MKTKWLYLTLLLVFVITGVNVPVAEAAPYEGYNYNYWGEAAPSPNAYLPQKVIDGTTLGAGDLKTPEDLFVAADQRIYLLDSGNGRIICMDKNWKVLRVITRFENGDKHDSFNKPEGIFVTEAGNIYVADTENRRVVELMNDGTFIREIGAPESDVLRANFEYFPRKIALDKAKRIYVIGRGVFDGIMEFDADGVFNSFMGTNRVRFNPLDYVWKKISTKAQREKMVLFIPVEFKNMDLDEEGFIYTTTPQRSGTFSIQRLNPAGTDVLRREGYWPPYGDLETSAVGAYKGFSQFVDIQINDVGMYSALDANRGRVFTFDEDGNLLYVTGMRGNKKGTFKTPVAVERLGEQLIVLDRDLQQINIYEPTQFGRSVNEAVKLHFAGKEEQSAEAWKQVLKLNTNYDIGYIGIGKALLRQEKNKEAMEYFKLGMSRKYYSKAFARYRKDVMREQFGTVMTTLLLLVVVFIGFRTFRRMRKGRLNTDAA